MAKKIGIAVAVVVVGFLVFVATRPSSFKYERSTTIAAPAEVIYPFISDFHGWDQWSPWEKLDPAMKKTYSGAPSGKGASYEWEGNKDVGKGRMTIIDAQPPTQVSIKLEFIEPIATTNTTVVNIAPQTGASKVTWSMTGENNFMSKAFGVFMNMDKMIGDDFEKGLASLKGLAEAEANKKLEPPPAPSGYAVPALDADGGIAAPAEADAGAAPAPAPAPAADAGK